MKFYIVIFTFYLRSGNKIVGQVELNDRMTEEEALAEGYAILDEQMDPQGSKNSIDCYRSRNTIFFPSMDWVEGIEVGVRGVPPSKKKKEDMG